MTDCDDRQDGKDSLMICNIPSNSSTSNDMNYVYTIHPVV